MSARLPRERRGRRRRPMSWGERIVALILIAIVVAGLVLMVESWLSA